MPLELRIPLPPLRATVGESQSIVNHRIPYYAEAAYKCRYGTPSKSDAMAMASIYEDFDCLFSMTNEQRNRAINTVKRKLGLIK